MSKHHVPTYELSILRKTDGAEVGRISLKVGFNQNIYYAGNIGYGIYPEYRGNHYACKACLLVFSLAKRHHMAQVIITCDPDNYPSRRTCQLLGAKELGLVSAPIDSEAYRFGMRKKIRYLVNPGQ